MQVLLCLGESPAKGSYTLPENLNFNERAEKRRKEEEESLTKLEAEIRAELEANEDIKRIKEEWRNELCESSGSDEEEDMQVDEERVRVPQYLKDSQREEREQEQGDIQWEQRSHFFGGLKIKGGLDAVAYHKAEEHYEERMDLEDEQALGKLLGVRSFKEIQRDISKRK